MRAGQRSCVHPSNDWPADVQNPVAIIERLNGESLSALINGMNRAIDPDYNSAEDITEINKPPTRFIKTEGIQLTACHYAKHTADEAAMTINAALKSADVK